MHEDRRRSPRQPASFHAQIETDAGRYTLAVTQDVSATGLLVLTHQEIAGRVTVHLEVDGEPCEVNGTVVRHEPLAGDSALWRARTAVAFDRDDVGAGRILAAAQA